MGETAVQTALQSFDRSEVTNTFRVKASSIVIPSTNIFTDVIRFAINKGFQGFLLALGHDASAVGFQEFTWRIVVRRLPVDGFGGQIGEQWGTINQPGEVFARIGNGSPVALQAKQSSGAPLTASGLLVGYQWPVNLQGNPVL